MKQTKPKKHTIAATRKPMQTKKKTTFQLSFKHQITATIKVGGEVTQRIKY